MHTVWTLVVVKKCLWYASGLLLLLGGGGTVIEGGINEDKLALSTDRRVVWELLKLLRQGHGM